MNEHRSKHPNLIDLELVRGSSKFEEGIISEREEIVEGMGENLPRRKRNVVQYQNLGASRTRRGDHYALIRIKLFTEIAPPIRENVNFKIDTAFINSLHNFHGLPSENPYTYLEELVGKCYLYHIPGESNEILQMKVFPQTLKDEAKDWFKNLGLKFEIEDCFLEKLYSS